MQREYGMRERGRSIASRQLGGERDLQRIGFEFGEGREGALMSQEKRGIEFRTWVGF